MKITDRFIGDHKTFKKLIKDLDGLPAQVETEADTRRLVRLVELFVDHLVIHAWGEDHFFYPRVAATSAHNAEMINRMEGDHAGIDALAQKMEVEAKRLHGGEWKAVYERFKKGLLAHMAEEEEVLFPASEAALGADGLSLISLEVERRRNEAPAIRKHQTF